MCQLRVSGHKEFISHAATVLRVADGQKPIVIEGKQGDRTAFSIIFYCFLRAPASHTESRFTHRIATTAYVANKPIQKLPTII